jgi:comEA protein
MSVWTDPLRGLRFSIIVVSLAFLVGGVIHRQESFQSAQIIPSADSAKVAEFQQRANLPPDSVWVKINVNIATAHELEALPGIGPVKAKKIVEYRTQNGPFRQPKELLAVKGIGPKTLQRITPLISLDTPDSSYQTLNKE